MEVRGHRYCVTHVTSRHRSPYWSVPAGRDVWDVETQEDPGACRGGGGGDRQRSRNGGRAVVGVAVEVEGLTKSFGSQNSGDHPAPEGSECQVTPDGGQSCTQTVQVCVLKVDGDWKISELTLLTTS